MVLSCPHATAEFTNMYIYICLFVKTKGTALIDIFYWNMDYRRFSYIERSIKFSELCLYSWNGGGRDPLDNIDADAQNFSNGNGNYN